MNPSPESKAKSVSLWLFICCAMIFIMVVIGGITRLTESGLSITEWKPVSGIIPPINEEAWQIEFEKYQTTPEFQILNNKMELRDYKKIYWWEYAHRLWGRLIGLAFFIPLIIFWNRKYILSDWKPSLIVMLILGANQGLLGWFMVESGLVDRTDVSQYRLTAHLVLASVIYAYMLWVALHIRNYYKVKSFSSVPALRPWAFALFILFALTFTMGGFMAGTNAGLVYADFPKYNGEWVPGGLLAMNPWYTNLFENTTTIHFVHRSLAILTVLGGLALAIYGIILKAPKEIKIPLFHVGVMGLIQMALGISTIARHIPISLAALHQGGGILLLTFLVWLLFSLRNPTAN